MLLCAKHQSTNDDKLVLSQSSPCVILPSCMSFIKLGVIQTTFSRLSNDLGNCEKGLLALPGTFENIVTGLCFSTYKPELQIELPIAGRSSLYHAKDLPASFKTVYKFWLFNGVPVMQLFELIPFGCPEKNLI